MNGDIIFLSEISSLRGYHTKPWRDRIMIGKPSQRPLLELYRIKHVLRTVFLKRKQPRLEDL